VSACGCTTIQACPLHASPVFTNTTGTRPSSCSQCGGSGEVTVERPGRRTVVVACGPCTLRRLGSIESRLSAKESP